MQAKHKDRTQRTQTQDARQPQEPQKQPQRRPTHVHPPAAGPQPRSGGIFAFHTKVHK